MAYGMVKDEQRGREYLEKTLGVSSQEIEQLPAEERDSILCRAFRASSSKYISRRFAFWTVAWLAFGVDTAVSDSENLKRYAASAFGTAWGVAEVVGCRRKRKELDTSIKQSLEAHRSGADPKFE